MKIYLKKYKADIISIIFLVIFFLLVLKPFWGHSGSLLYDNGREVYLPQLILNGKVLYKDIFGMYNPLSYQINALFYLLFGNNLNVLYCVGVLNSIIIILLLYFILRQFISCKFTLLILIFLILHVILRRSVVNYIFPYAYAMIYATSFFLLSVLFGIIYIKNPQKSHNIFLSFFMLGISVANKPEYVLCIIPLLYTLFLQKQNLKFYIANIFIFFLPLIVSYGILFIQGLTWKNLINYIIFIKNFFNTSEQQFYNSNIIPSLNFKKCYIILIDFLIFCFVFFMPIFLFKLSKIKNFLKYFSFPFYILLLYLYYILSYYSYYYYPACLLTWVCFANFIIVIFFAKEKNNMLVFLSLCSIFSCFRLNFITDGAYCIYMCLLPILVCMICFSEYMNFRFINKNEKIIPFIFLSLFGFFTYGQNINMINHTNYVKTITYGKGELYTAKNIAEPFNKAVKWIINNTDPKDTVLVLPEGLFINYFTNRPTNPKYYHLIPNHISAIGEDNIVSDLRKNLPDYFILNNTSYRLYGASYMCNDFGFKICDLINKNYNLVQKYGENEYYHILIFKLRNL